MVNYWIFNVKDDENAQYRRKGKEIYEHRMGDRFWGLHECTEKGRKTPNVAKLKESDMVLFYLAGNDGHCFLGTSVLASSFRKLQEEEKADKLHEEWLDWPSGVDLGSYEEWKDPLPIECLRGKIYSVPPNGNYGKYFQGSIKKTSASDYAIIVQEHCRQMDNSAPE